MELPVEIIRTGSDQVSETESLATLVRAVSCSLERRPWNSTVLSSTWSRSLLATAESFTSVVWERFLRLESFPSEESEVPSVVVAVSLERYEFQRFKQKNLSQAEVA